MSAERTEIHPCFNPGASRLYGRIHLPVAPRCNVQCNYCNRKYDCANESRPGVTSAVLSPGQALHYLDEALARDPSISVAGIAGPGDAFANPEETLETLRGINRKHPRLHLCLSTNGLNLAPYLEELVALKVSHLTLTVNAIDPAVGAMIYAWARDGNCIYRGEMAARILLDRQRAALERLKHLPITVKANAIMIPGVNDESIPEVARCVAEWGADLFNCIPLCPAPGSNFDQLSEPTPESVSEARHQAEAHLPQMRHCARCRADAVGKLHQPKHEEFAEMLIEASRLPLRPEEDRPCIAVASYEGMLVNQHLGEATELSIYRKTEEGFDRMETRKTPPPGGGTLRWKALAETLSDCRAVLTSSAGDSPTQALKREGIQVIEMSGLILDGLEAVFSGKGVRQLQSMRIGRGKGSGCSGDRAGCG